MTPSRIRHHDQRGIALLLSLLLMAALTAAGIGASTIVINEIKTTATTDAGISAYYAADIGMERSLYSIFSGRIIGMNLGDAAAPPYWTVFGHIRGNNPPFTLTGGNTVDMSSTTIEASSKTVSLKKENSAAIGLINESAPFSPAPGGSIPRRINIWAPNNATAWAEVQWSYILKTDPTRTPVPANNTLRLVHPNNLTSNATGSTGGVSIDLATGQVSPLHAGDPAIPSILEPEIGVTTEGTFNIGEVNGWVVRIKALYGDIASLTVEAETQSGAIYPIQGDLNLVSRGAAGTARARLDAIVPWRLPTSGLFDYVVFSEGNLDKPGT